MSAMVDSFEKIPVKIHANSKEGSRYVATEIARLIREKQQAGQKCVLGLDYANYFKIGKMIFESL